MIYYAKVEDLQKIAALHMKAFPNTLSVSLGIKYVEKMLGWYLASDKTFLFYTVSDSGAFIGYCGGIVNDGTLQTGSASGMLQYSFREAIKGILKKPWLIFHPEIRSRYKFILKNIKNRIKPAKKSPITTSTDKIKEPNTGLVVIGVDPAYQGKGIGSLLLQEFENKSKAIGVKKMFLTVFCNNEKAIKSYERNGWNKNITDGKSVNMTKDISI